jgi:hypothetical protein
VTIFAFEETTPTEKNDKSITLHLLFWRECLVALYFTHNLTPICFQKKPYTYLVGIHQVVGGGMPN